jgi:hypothetical protein
VVSKSLYGAYTAKADHFLPSLKIALSIKTWRLL